MSIDEDDEDIDLPSIESLAKARLPIVIPWSRLCSNVGPGSLFQTSAAGSGSTDPWSKISPFKQSPDTEESGYGHSVPMTYSSSSGTTGTFKSSVTSSAVENNDHLTVGLKVSMDAFIVSASVKGQYDKHVQENDDVSTTV